MFLDLWMNKVSFKWYHFWTVSIFSIFYIIANVSMWAADGTVLYTTLDWGVNTGLSAGIAIGVVFVASPIIHGIMCLLVCLREFLASNCCKVTEQNRVVVGGHDNHGMI